MMWILIATIFVILIGIMSVLFWAMVSEIYNKADEIGDNSDSKKKDEI